MSVGACALSVLFDMSVGACDLSVLLDMSVGVCVLSVLLDTSVGACALSVLFDMSVGACVVSVLLDMSVGACALSVPGLAAAAPESRCRPTLTFVCITCTPLSQRLTRPSKIMLVTILWSHDTVILLFIPSLVQPSHNIWYPASTDKPTDRKTDRQTDRCIRSTETARHNQIPLTLCYLFTKVHGVTSQKAAKY